MSRQRYLIALTLGALVLAGCHDREPRPSMYGPRSDSQLVRPAGDRTVVRDPDGGALLKLRINESGRWDVFDISMQFSGQVRSDSGYVEWRPRRTDDWTAATLHEETWEMPGKVRLEALGDGWTVFDAKNEMLGYVRHIDGHWERRESFDGEATWTANDDELKKVGGDTPHTLVGDSPGDGVLIALTFEGLGVVEQVALGRFIDSEAAAAAVSNVKQLATKKAAERAAAKADAGFIDVGVAGDAAIDAAAEDSAEP